jgi:DNA-binding transcriptional MocR family regulator
LGCVTVGDDGLNLWLPVRDETAALLYLAHRGIVAAAGSPFATKNGGGSHLRITVGLIVDDFERVAGELALASKNASEVGPR